MDGGQAIIAPELLAFQGLARDFAPVRAAEEFQELECPDGSGDWTLACWEAYDPASKVDLHACSVTLRDGQMFFVDPVALAPDALENLLFAFNQRPTAVLLTNGNHARAADDFRRRLKIPLGASAAAAVAAGLTADFTVPDAGGPIFDGVLEAIPLPGAAAGETAFYRADGGLVIVGDALIHMGSHGFAILPDKYCEHPGELRRSLARLAERRFSTMIFAHGGPIVDRADERLRTLLAA